MKLQTGTFYGVGLGPGDPGLLTVKALTVLCEAGQIYTVASRQSERSVSRSILAAYPEITAPVAELEFTMSTEWGERQSCIDRHAGTVAAKLTAGMDCAFGTIGDPMTYSTCSYLLRALRRLLPELRSVIVPGVNSWSALAAGLQQPLAEDDEVLRIIPGYRSGVELPELPECSTTILLKTYRTRNRLLDQLPPDAGVIYGAEIGLPGEILSVDREVIAGLPEAYLSMLAVKRRKNHD